MATIFTSNGLNGISGTGSLMNVYGSYTNNSGVKIGVFGAPGGASITGPGTCGLIQTGLYWVCLPNGSTLNGSGNWGYVDTTIITGNAL